MKLIFATLITLSCIQLGFCQGKNSAIIGKWKIVSVSSENDFYYDAKKDSLFLSKEFERIFPNDPQMLEDIKNMMRLSYKTGIHIFDENGMQIETSDSKSTHFIYAIDELNKKIKIFNQENHSLVSEMPYEIKNGKLIYSMKLENLGMESATQFVLEKI